MEKLSDKEREAWLKVQCRHCTYYGQLSNAEKCCMYILKADDVTKHRVANGISMRNCSVFKKKKRDKSDPSTYAEKVRKIVEKGYKEELSYRKATPEEIRRCEKITEMLKETMFSSLFIQREHLGMGERSRYMKNIKKSKQCLSKEEAERIEKIIHGMIALREEIRRTVNESPMTFREISRIMGKSAGFLSNKVRMTPDEQTKAEIKAIIARRMETDTTVNKNKAYSRRMMKKCEQH